MYLSGEYIHLVTVLFCLIWAIFSILSWTSLISYRPCKDSETPNYHFFIKWLKKWTLQTFQKFKKMSTLFKSGITMLQECCHEGKITIFGVSSTLILFILQWKSSPDSVAQLSGSLGPIGLRLSQAPNITYTGGADSCPLIVAISSISSSIIHFLTQSPSIRVFSPSQFNTIKWQS